MQPRSVLGSTLVGLLLVLALAVMLPPRVQSQSTSSTPPAPPAGQQAPRREAENISLIQQVGGGSHAIALQGNHAYLGVGYRLFILDISNPAAPSLRGQSALLPGLVRDVQVRDGLAYVASDQGGLHILDVANPASPIELSYYDTPGDALGLGVSGDYAYVATEKGGLRIIHVGNPAAPAEIALYQPQLPGYLSPSEILDVAVQGNYAYVPLSNEGRFHVLNVMDPTAPVLVGDELMGQYARGITAAGNYVYVHSFSDLEVFNVSSPIAPMRVSDNYYQELGPITDVAINGNYAFVTSEGTGRLHILNVTNPASITDVTSFPVAGKTFAVAVGDGNAYIGHDSGLGIVDVSPPGSPYLRGGYETKGAASFVTVVGNYAYVGGKANGLRVFDISNPAAPAETSVLETQGRVGDMVVRGNHAYLTAGSMLRIADLSDPATPDEVATYNSPAFRLAISGNYLYALEPGNRVVILDISNPTAPSQVGVYQNTQMSTAKGLAVAGNYIYVITEFSDLRVVDISTPATPTEVAVTDIPGYASAITIVGNRAYVASGIDYNQTGTLWILDLSDPAQPARVGSATVRGPARDVVVEGNYAYVAASRGGLAVLNVSNPASITEVAYYDTSDVAGSVAVAGNHLYVADNAGGLVILTAPADPAPPTRTPTATPSITRTPTPRPTATPITVQEVSQIGGLAHAVEARDGYVYVGIGTRLVILDVTQPAQFVPVAETGPLGGLVRAIAFDGDYAYVAASEGGLYLLDVSNPAAPTEVGHLNTPGETNGIALAGDYVYLADGTGGFHIVDASTPSAPVLKGGVDTPGNQKDVEVVGQYAYVAERGYLPYNGPAEGGGFRVYDVSNPDAPVQVGYFGLVYATGVEVVGDYAYVNAGDLYRLDISDPANPAHVGQEYVNSQSVTVAGNYMYVTDYQAGLRIYDVSDPGSPRGVQGYYGEQSNWTSNIAVAGDHLYVADDRQGLRAFHLPPSAPPAPVGTYHTASAYDVALVGNRVYTIGDGLTIYDVTDTAQPVRLGHHSQEGLALAVSGDYVYTVDNNQTLRVIDASDPAEPVLVGDIYTRAYPNDIVVVGDYAYVTMQTSGLNVFDVSDPTDPRYVTRVGDEWGFIWSVTVVGNHAYVADSDYGMHVLDITNPRAPVQIARVGISGNKVAVAGQYAYVASRPSQYGTGAGLTVLNVADPRGPYRVGQHAMSDGVDVAVSGPYAFVLEGEVWSEGQHVSEGGLRVLNVAYPDSISEVAAYDTHGTPSRVITSGGHVYIADTEGGLLILRWQAEPGPPPIYLPLIHRQR